MKDGKTVYFCDGYGCEHMCAEKKTPEEWAKYECHHTENESHARNKIRRDRKFQSIELPDGSVRRIEV